MRILGVIAGDLGRAFVWAALIAAVVLFSGGPLTYIYMTF